MKINKLARLELFIARRRRARQANYPSVPESTYARSKDTQDYFANFGTIEGTLRAIEIHLERLEEKLDKLRGEL